MDLSDATTESGTVIHLSDHIGQEKHLTITRTCDQRKLLAVVHYLKTRIPNAVLTAHILEIHLPAFAIGRIGEQEVKFFSRKSVMRQGGPLCAAHDVLSILPFALKEHVRFANSVSFRANLLAIEVAIHI